LSLLLDTTVLIDVVRGNATVKAWVAGQRLDDLYVTTVTVGELHRGLHHKFAWNPARLAWALEHLRDDELGQFEGRVLSFDREVAEIWGRLMGEAAARGRLPPVDDAKIAATAIRHGMTVATSNAADFVDMVPVLDPRTA
jgi:predicted nucleic acid-binding protein